MEIGNFVKDFEEQFEKIEPGTVTPDSDFKNIKGWDSLTAMLVIDMINANYGKTIMAQDLRECKTVEQLFNRVQSIP